MPKKYTVDKDYHNSRFDRWFKANVINLPQSLIEKIIRKNIPLEKQVFASWNVVASKIS